jgi:hypothetical protein
MCLLPACLSGCYAGVGPTVGVVVPSGTPTLGWEASAASFTVAQSYATRPPPERPGRPTWTSRTYVLWEPRVGAQVTDDKRFYLGGGASVGVQWTHARSLPEPDFHMQGGGWAGGVFAISSEESLDSCARNDRAYVSLALGVRGDEISLTPKVGWMTLPAMTTVCAVR